MLLISALGWLAGCADPARPEPPEMGLPALTITPEKATVTLGGSTQLNAKYLDDRGNPDPSVAISWTSTDTTRARVDQTGRVSSVYPGVVMILATAGELSDSAIVTVVSAYSALSLLPRSSTILQGTTHPLFARAPGYGARTRDWRPGELEWTSSDPSIATVDSMGLVTALAPGQVQITVRGEGLTSAASVQVFPPVVITAISVGGDHTCAISSERQALCWGTAAYGAVGVFTAPFFCNQYGCALRPARFPLPVPTQDPIKTISASSEGAYFAHTCALTASGQALCWGNNYYGQLGRATEYSGCTGGSFSSGQCSFLPVPADLQTALVEIGSGSGYTCGIAADGKVFCWGASYRGRAGASGSENTPVRPQELQAPSPLASLSVGNRHACGLDEDGRAYCWGDNSYGQLGTGMADTLSHPVPTPAAADLRFSAISTGNGVTCALSREGYVYCWGDDPGGLQRGAEASRSAGLVFSSVAVDRDVVCGIAQKEAYCWGKLPGDTSQEAEIQTTPTPVAPGFRWHSISLGVAGLCGITVEEVAYCWSGTTPVALGGQR